MVIFNSFQLPIKIAIKLSILTAHLIYLLRKAVCADVSKEIFIYKKNWIERITTMKHGKELKGLVKMDKLKIGRYDFGTIPNHTNQLNRSLY